jgi:hypothetical protein
MGVAPRRPPSRGDRKAIAGWSERSAASNAAFLRSVDGSKIEGCSLSCTLTIGSLVTCQQWLSIRQRFVYWLRCEDAVLAGHWLVEFQSRGAPHMHLFLVLDWSMAFQFRSKLMKKWLDLVSITGALERGQFTSQLDDPLGWLRYLARHGSRSISHYQRDGLPPGWFVSGRLWGRFGDWAVRSDRFVCNDAVYFHLRRVAVRLMIQEARRDLDTAWLFGESKKIQAIKTRIKELRRRFRSRDPWKSASTGVSDWVLTSDFRRWLHAQTGVLPNVGTETLWYYTPFGLQPYIWPVGAWEMPSVPSDWYAVCLWPRGAD